MARLSSPDDRQPGRARRGRAPLPVRRKAERREARRRIAARPQQALTAAQRAFNPLARTRASRARRLAIAILAIAASVGVHLSVIGGAIWSRAGGKKTSREEVLVQVREREPEKKPPPPPPPAPVEHPVRPRVIAKAPPPPPAPPPPSPPKAKPVRVVGLSLESTAGEGGDGPAFAAGNTRMGETAEKAVAAKDIGGAPKGDTQASVSGTGNKTASRIPVAGVKYVSPKRKHPKPPPYPATLKTQGIEGDVTVLVSLDATGKVLSVKIIKGAPYPEFDEAARTAALAEEFDPAMRDDVPIPYTLSYTYRFRLEDE